MTKTLEISSSVAAAAAGAIALYCGYWIEAAVLLVWSAVAPWLRRRF